jgi:hypothetical protein
MEDDENTGVLRYPQKDDFLRLTPTAYGLHEIANTRDLLIVSKGRTPDAVHEVRSRESSRE